MLDLFAPRGVHSNLASIADLIDASADCWEWTGVKGSTGYGVTSIKNKPKRVHRVVWEALVGEIPDNMVLDHMCRNRRCCNPDHLRVVTQRQNVLENSMAVSAQNLRKTSCKEGHVFTAENTYKVPNGRKCLTCQSAGHKRRHKLRMLGKRFMAEHQLSFF